MTNLNCGVGQCAHNKSNLCCLESIDVGGMEAVSSEHTCCKSFVEQSQGAFSNDVSNPSPTAEIGCRAENCQYNSDCKCHADSINVAGDYACCESDTCCSTFKCK